MTFDEIRMAANNISKNFPGLRIRVNHLTLVLSQSDFSGYSYTFHDFLNIFPSPFSSSYSSPLFLPTSLTPSLSPFSFLHFLLTSLLLLLSLHVFLLLRFLYFLLLLVLHLFNVLFLSSSFCSPSTVLSFFFLTLIHLVLFVLLLLFFFQSFFLSSISCMSLFTSSISITHHILFPLALLHLYFPFSRSSSIFSFSSVPPSLPPLPSYPPFFAFSCLFL